MNAKLKRGQVPELNVQQWLEREKFRRAEAARRAALQRQPTPGFAPMQMPTLGEELVALFDEHRPRPQPHLDSRFKALPRQRPPKSESFHGTAGGYTNHRCRCDDCRSAARAMHAEWKRKARLSVPPQVHGTLNGYENYTCRCEPCREAGGKGRAQNLKDAGSMPDLRPQPTVVIDASMRQRGA